jgi:hypothetical protein
LVFIRQKHKILVYKKFWIKQEFWIKQKLIFF